jgi:hypothetical protein
LDLQELPETSRNPTAILSSHLETSKSLVVLYIQGGPKVGIQFPNTPSKSTFFVLYLSSLPSFTIPVKKKKALYLLLAHPV